MTFPHASAAVAASRKTGRRRGRLLALALAAALAVPMIVGAAPSAASHAPANCTSSEGPGPLCLHIADTPDPVAYSTFDGNQSYLAYDATVENQSESSSLPNVVLTEDLPVDGGGGSLTLLSEEYSDSGVVSVETSQGSCSVEGDFLYCELGSLDPGDVVTVTVVITAPETLDETPESQVITNFATASFFIPFEGEGGVYDEVSYEEDTTVTGTAGQTFVPEGGDAQVGTDPGDAQYANLSITNATESLLASIEILPPDNFCQNGRVRVGFSVYVCRAGSFARASVTEVDDGSQYFNAQDPLVFHLRWDDELVSPLQTKRNFVMFYQSHVGAKTQVIKKRCGGFLPKLPCVKNIELHADGSLEADLVKPDNGRMR
jgi:hypothetical protein